jgi:hypothetical protein
VRREESVRKGVCGGKDRDGSVCKGGLVIVLKSSEQQDRINAPHRDVVDNEGIMKAYKIYIPHLRRGDIESFEKVGMCVRQLYHLYVQ